MYSQSSFQFSEKVLKCQQSFFDYCLNAIYIYLLKTKLGIKDVLSVELQKIPYRNDGFTDKYFNLLNSVWQIRFKILNHDRSGSSNSDVCRVSIRRP